MALREAREGEQSISRFLQAVGDGATFKPPFSKEDFSLGLDLLPGVGVNYVVVVGRHFLVQAVRRVGEQVAVLVHGAALDRRLRPKRRKRLIEAGAAIDDNEFWSSQSLSQKVACR